MSPSDLWKVFYGWEKACFAEGVENSYDQIVLQPRERNDLPGDSKLDGTFMT